LCLDAKLHLIVQGGSKFENNILGDVE